MNTKLVTYFGFAIRSGKAVFGVDDIEMLKKRAYLIVADESLGESSKKTVQKSQERFTCPLLFTSIGVLGEYLHRPAVKAVAIRDENLALAIIKEAEQEKDFRKQ
jgi:hypothetical protein